MCTGCFSTVDTVIVQATIATALARTAVTRVGDRLTGRDATDRRRAAYRDNAAFLRTLGHDPAAVLGPPPPNAPTPAPAPVPHRLGAVSVAG